MTCPHCQGAEDVFTIKYARSDLKKYRKNGAEKTTALMLNAIKQLGFTDRTLLDIGGGIGIISHELIAEGLASSLDVDASQAYINAAQEEANRRGHADKIDFQHGDFVQLAPQITSADIVTLDRMICCYPDFEALVDLSSQRAEQIYAVVFPRDNILTHPVIGLLNFLAFRLNNNPFRTYIHNSDQIHDIIRGNGFQRTLHKKLLFWQVMVYQK
ncbi:MAG: methyltransferase domain-containing protein [Chloroflexota bacterium]